MGAVNAETLANALKARGFSNAEIYNFVAIARGESSFLFESVNRHQEGGDAGDDSWGLFQINFTKGAAGDQRAKSLGIPTKKDGLPTVAGLAAYFGLTRTKNADGSYSYTPRKGVIEEELIEKNIKAMEIMWNGEDYSAWSVHPDNGEFENNERAQQIWAESTEFADDLFLDEYGEFAFQYDKEIPQQPDDSWNVGQYTPKGSDPVIEGPSQREIELENFYHLRRDEGADRAELHSILEQIIDERNREGYPNPPEGTQEMVDGVPEAPEVISVDFGNDYEFLRGNPDGDVEFEGEIWNIVDLIEAEKRRELFVAGKPFFFEDEDPALGLWIQNLYQQTQHFFDSEEGRGLRENDWFLAGEGDEYTNRRRDLIEKYVTKVEKIFDEAGIVATEVELLDFARDAWLAGWSDDAIRDAVSEREDMEFGADAPVASEINATRQEINDLYRQYLIDPDPDVISDANRRIWRGETDITTIEAGLASESADLYPAWADRIEAGRTPLAILSSYNSIFRSVMGYMPEWDGTHRSLGMELGSGDGNITGAGFARYLRTTEEYDMTPNAINAAYDLVGTIGRTMGVMA